MKTNFVTIALAAAALPLLGADCQVLHSGQTLELTVSRAHLPCFDVDVAANEAAQLALESPFDFALHIRRESTERLVDSFEFGRETATLLGPASYLVTVRALSPGSASSHILMSRNPLPLQAASAWFQAEDVATLSKAQPSMNNTLCPSAPGKNCGMLASIARTRIARGILVYSAGEYREAIDSFEQARSGCAAIGDTRCVAEAITDEGMAANRIGEYANALQLTQQAVPEWRRIGDQLNLGRTLSNLG